MNIIERNKKIMKKFEKMINTADEKLAEELIDSNASFYTPASSKYIFTPISIITDSLIFMPETPNFTGFFLSEIFRNRKNQTGQERTFTTPKRTQNF